MKEIDREQRRARLGWRHSLARPAHDPADVADDLVAIHSSNPSTVFLSMWARVAEFQVNHVEDLLYEQRSLVRHWAMRRTLWVMSRQMLPLAVGSTTRPLARKELKKTADIIEKDVISVSLASQPDPLRPEWQRRTDGLGPTVGRSAGGRNGRVARWSMSCWRKSTAT